MPKIIDSDSYINAVEKELLRRKLEGSLFDFTLWVFEKIYRRPFAINWHHKVLCEVLHLIHSGSLKHTIITLPPRHTKTEIVVKIFVAWCYAKNFSCEFIHLAYSDDLALANSSAIKTIIESVEFQELWPLEFKKDSTAKKKWKTLAGGEMSAAASGGSVTGFGCGKLGAKEFSGMLIIDDPLKPEDSNSTTVRNSINNRFPQTIISRLNDRNTPLVLIQQRLHENDPVGYLLDGNTELDFTHINLPAINEDGPNEYDPREVGEALWPFKMNLGELREMEKKSPMIFAGQYQQRPAPADGNIIKKADIKYYYRLPEDMDYFIHSWDFTFKKSDNSDYVVGQVWGRSKDRMDFYLVDQYRDKMSFTESLGAIKHMAKKHSDYRAVLIEEKANGSAIIDSVRRVINRMIAINPTESKQARFEAVAPLFAAGNVYLPHSSIAPWVKLLVTELLTFPNSKHDDQCDALSQSLNWLDQKSSMPFTSRNVEEVQSPYHKEFHRKKKARKSRIKITS